VNTPPRTTPELLSAAWAMAGPNFENMNAIQVRKIEKLVNEAYERGKLDGQHEKRPYECDPGCGCI
jgi:hypothetical protein